MSSVLQRDSLSVCSWLRKCAICVRECVLVSESVCWCVRARACVHKCEGQNCEERQKASVSFCLSSLWEC